MITYPEYARRGQNQIWRYVITGLLAITLGFLGSILFLTPLMLMGVLGHDFGPATFDPRHPREFFIVTGVMFACMAGGLALAARWVQGKTPADLIGAWTWRGFALAFAAWTIFLALGALVDFLIDPHGFTVSASADTWGLAGMALLALIPQVFAEELFFRGWLTQGLRLALPDLPTAIVSGLCFGALHIPNGVPQAASSVVFGIATAWMALRLGGLAVPLGLHLANNLFGAVVIVSAQDVFNGLPGLLRQSTPRLTWWDPAMSALGLTLLALWALQYSLRPQRALVGAAFVRRGWSSASLGKAREDA